MAQIAGYAFDEGTGTTAAEIGGGTTITGVPGWAAGRNGNAMNLALSAGPTVDPYAADTNFTIMFDVYLLGSGGSGYNLLLDGGPGLLGTVQTGPSGSGDLEWYHDSAGLSVVTSVLSLNTWYNICISSDGTTRKLYLNGTLVASRTTATRSVDNPIKLGGELAGGYVPNFRMDNLRFHDAALNDATVAALAGTAVTNAGVSTTVSPADNLGITDTAGVEGVLQVSINDNLAITDLDVSQALEITESFDDALGMVDSVAANSGLANIPPVAVAGPDQTVTPGQLVTLNGSASIDQDDVVASYDWVQISGPVVTLTGTGATRTFTPASAGTYVFGLTVTDSNGAPSAQDTVTITTSSVQDLLIAAGYVPYIIVPL